MHVACQNQGRCEPSRGTPEPGLRIAFVADPDGNLVELLSSDQIVQEL